MGSVTDRANELADIIREADPDHDVSTDIRDVPIPGWLVVPLPDWDFDVAGPGGVTLTWAIYAVHPGPGDLQAADELGDMVAKLHASELSIETARPARYQLPTQSDPLPAYQCNTTETVEVTP